MCVCICSTCAWGTRQVLAGLISRWLRSRGLARIPAEHHAVCTAYTSKGRPTDSSEAVQEVKKLMELVEARSAQTAVVLKAVVELLQRVDPEATQMTPQNLGVVFGPVLIHREDPQAFAKHAKVCLSAPQTLQSDAVVTDSSQSCPPFCSAMRQLSLTVRCVHKQRLRTGRRHVCGVDADPLAGSGAFTRMESAEN